MKRKDVVGALIIRNGRVLLAQRACENLKEKWEFPGGKVEPGETHIEALVREIWEELSLEITITEKVGFNHFQVGKKLYSLHCYWASICHGEPTTNEHLNVVWVLPQELLAYDLAPADIPIAKEAINRDW